MGRKLPKYVHLKKNKMNKEYHYLEYRKVRILLPHPTSTEFQAAYERALATAGIDYERPVEVDFKTPSGGCYFAEMERSARGRARVANREYSLPKGWMKERFQQQDGRCAVTQRLLEKRSAVSRDPWAPSIDRIDPTKGYTPENCRIVAYAVNVAMNQFDKATVLAVAEGIIRSHGGTVRGRNVNIVTPLETAAVETANPLKTLEASIGIEPIYTDLQSVARKLAFPHVIKHLRQTWQLETLGRH